VITTSSSSRHIKLEMILESSQGGGSGGSDMSRYLQVFSPWYKIESLDILFLLFNDSHCSSESML